MQNSRALSECAAVLFPKNIAPNAKQPWEDLLQIKTKTGFYHRFGFKAASEFGIVFEDGSSFPELMAIELIPGGLANVNGRINFAPKFSNIDSEKLAHFDSQFPKKEKKKLPSQLW